MNSHNPDPDARTGTAHVNLQELLDAAATPKAALQSGQQQYQTPQWFASALHELLPNHTAAVIFDPQCADGNLLDNALWATKRFGCELDRRMREPSLDVRDKVLHRITGSCVALWDVMDDLYPELTFDCQVANPPFGLRWKSKDGPVDSTEFTWRNLLKRTAQPGYGFFIANAATVERLGIHTHPWVYLYQKFPAGLWKNTTAEIGVVHWFRADASNRPQWIFVDYRELLGGRFPNRDDIAIACERVHSFFGNHYFYDAPVNAAAVTEAWEQLSGVLAEDARRNRPEFNLSLAADGSLRLYLSLRHQIQRKLTPEHIERLMLANGAHPLQLVHAVETRRLLRELISSGAYTASPEAQRAIEHALREAARQAVPIMPVTDFERIAYADEYDALTAADGVADSPFHPGRRYPTTTGSYRFTERFARRKSHWAEGADAPEIVNHDCELSGQDAYLEVFDDAGQRHLFLAHPETAAIRTGDATLHPEADLWRYFIRPDVPDVATLYPDAVAANRQRLLAMQTQP